MSACDATIYAKELFEYDGLGNGNVSAGNVTSHTVERQDDTGMPLGSIVEFNATYDAGGNPSVVTTSREDRASRTVTTTYDPFGLAPTNITVTASSLPTLGTSITRDLVTLDALSVTDPNGTQHGTAFDGFGRAVQSTVTPPGGTTGVLSTIAYVGFTGSDLRRSIVTTAFPDAAPLCPDGSAVPPVCPGAVGHQSTARLDELGRSYRTEIALGSNYQGQTLVVGSRVYDGLGRVQLAREPFVATSGQADPPAYAMTYFFKADGTPSCFVRGTELQQYTEATDEQAEIFPTCFKHTFENYSEVVEVQDSASLLHGSPQDGVKQRSELSAIGRTLTRSTYSGSTRLEHAMFGYDRLGHRTSMTRYQDANAGANGVTTSWHFDSLGQMTELDEPATTSNSVPLLNSYSDWGELLQSYRFIAPTQSSGSGSGSGHGDIDGDNPSSGGDPSPTIRSVVRQYDALGRLIHTEEQTDGVADPDTLNDYVYDQGVNASPYVSPTFVLGRLAQANSPTSSVSFSYDALGRTNAQVFMDPHGQTYVEKHAFFDDGSPKSLTLRLPDTGYAAEDVEYRYDSAGRPLSVQYTGADTQDLFNTPTTGTPTTDALGRLRQAQFGQATYTASYAEVGRRLLTQVAVSSSLGSRAINFPDYDPVGRERSRSEIKDGIGTGTTTTAAYDALGRLSSSVKSAGSTKLFDQSFSYDPLGNVLTMSDAAATPAPTSTALTYLNDDRDRICRVAFGNDTSSDCNVTYDELGSITSQQTANGLRQYTYYLDGSVRTISDDHGTSAQFRYDAFGQVQELHLTSTTSPDTRNDLHYGELLVWHDVMENGSATPVLSRQIPGPGVVATRHGAGGPWTFEFAEGRGSRFSIDQDGAFAQDVDYQPFGTAGSTGAQPGSNLYTHEQWNGGDALAALGLSQLGARIYDPSIGRFLSRDPLLIPRSSATTNPYTFAFNDPVNSSDPSGLDPPPEGDPGTPSTPDTSEQWHSSNDQQPSETVDPKANAQRIIGARSTKQLTSTWRLDDDANLRTLLYRTSCAERQNTSCFPPEQNITKPDSHRSYTESEATAIENALGFDPDGMGQTATGLLAWWALREV